jgi:hypothetical protein
MKKKQQADGMEEEGYNSEQLVAFCVVGWLLFPSCFSSFILFCCPSF